MKKLTFLLLAIVVSISAKSQDLDALLKAGDDASLLFQNYMEPVMDGMTYSLNDGWVTTAKTHKKLGFDLTINVSTSIVPNSSRTFQFNATDYKYLSLQSGNSEIQTVMGGNNTTKIDVRIPYSNGNFKITEINMPDGLGGDLPLNAVPSPMIQASVGIPFSTDISIRFLPKINTNDVDGNLFGAGIKHNLMQYFGPLDKLPLNVALFVGYTTITSTYNLQNVSTLDGNNQEVDFKLNAFTIQAVASLDFPIITLFGSLGFDKGNSTLKVKGSYKLVYIDATTNISLPPITVNNPINMNFNTNGFRGTLGARLNLGFFKIYGNYTIKEYNTISTGISFSFR
ncbi:MAG: hypothetical protein COC22_02815 [Flavobacteriaceae bacterium]|nr:MAG: hypothetical protein COC22_02815 [Flavobacteriaceae bacterium]